MKLFLWGSVFMVIGILITAPSCSSDDIQTVDSHYRQLNANSRPDLYSDCCLRPGFCVSLKCKNVCDSRSDARLSSRSECKRSKDEK
jgi:hypothetical protein